MDGSIRDMADEVEHLVAQLGRLPDAPIAMPKQRLEEPPHGMLSMMDRVLGKSTLPVGQVRRSGR